MLSVEDARRAALETLNKEYQEGAYANTGKAGMI